LVLTNIIMKNLLFSTVRLENQGFIPEVDQVAEIHRL
jgi:hypothetical protein